MAVRRRWHDVVDGAGAKFASGDTVRVLYKLFILPKGEKGKTRFFSSQSNPNDRTLYLSVVLLCFVCLFAAIV